MPASRPDTFADTCYRPRSAAMWRAGAFFTLCAVVTAWVPVKAIWTSGVLPDVHGVFMLVLACGSLAFAVLGLAAAALGLPRLTVTPSGIRSESALRTQWANWQSLGAFQVAPSYVSRRGRRVLAARAPIIGTGVSKNLRHKQQFAIPDSFQTPIASIVGELNARHPHALASGPAAPADADAAAYGVADFKVPWLTIALLAGLIVVFVGEQIFAIDPPGKDLSPSLLTLQALGGLIRSAVITNGEWYRLITAPLLHANLLHLVFNGIALLMAGFILEKLVGRAWFLALFVVGALGGSLMSLAVNSPSVVSVGASGAIMAMFAAVFVGSYRVPEGAARSRIQVRSFRVLIPSLLPLATTAGAIRIDYGAHIGGALTGLLAGLLLLRAWPATSRLPGLPRLARGIAVAGMILIIASSLAVAGHYARYQAIALMIPASQVPKTEAEMEDRALDLVARYPQDPRSHMFLGQRLLRAHDYAAAERELETAMEQGERLNLGRRFDVIPHSTLAAVLLEDGQRLRAKDAAQVACKAPPADQPPPQLKQALLDAHLCD
jgi:rhomboid protease GluP